ncbi:MAG: ribose 5-phosphate isomerase B [Deltaproteobacteria bacterium]|jgi:ribose 5-phosphate isomerase B|nr:ribose 5-phosphate isomerase B [Deltaproteobacteria bacterium]
MSSQPLASKTIFLGSDHAGFGLKSDLAAWLKSLGLKVEDCGAHSGESCDYPMAAHKVCHAVLAGDGIGVLVCGSGIGMSIAANRHRGIRAALCTHEFHARGCRAHNNANIICLGERITAPALARELVELFLTTPFEGGRHERRLELIEED